MKALMKCRQVGLSSKWELLLFVLLYSSSYHFWDSVPTLCLWTGGPVSFCFLATLAVPCSSPPKSD